MPEAISLTEKLGLYQVFLKIYEHNRALLNEILSLEDGGTPTLGPLDVRYVLGVVGEPQPYLITNLLSHQTQAILQPDSIWTIGRGSQAAILVPDERLSRQHAAIQYRAEAAAFYLDDLGSTNGSFVNGELIHYRHRLTDGDRVRLGSLVFTFFECGQQLEQPPAPSQILAHLDRNTAAVQTSEQKARSTNPFLDQLPEVEEMVTQPLPKLTPAQQARILDRFFQCSEEED